MPSGVSVIGDVEDICNARLTFENGCVANLTASRLAIENRTQARAFSSDAYVSLDYQKRHGIVVHRSGNVDAIRDAVARIRCGEIQDLSRLNFADLVTIEELQIDDVEPLRAELESFVNAVKNRSAPEVPAEDGLAAVISQPKLFRRFRRKSYPKRRHAPQKIQRNLASCEDTSAINKKKPRMYIRGSLPACGLRTSFTDSPYRCRRDIHRDLHAVLIEVDHAGVERFFLGNRHSRVSLRLTQGLVDLRLNRRPGSSNGQHPAIVQGIQLRDVQAFVVLNQRRDLPGFNCHRAASSSSLVKQFFGIHLPSSNGLPPWALASLSSLSAAASTGKISTVNRLFADGVNLVHRHLPACADSWDRPRSAEQDLLLQRVPLVWIQPVKFPHVVGRDLNERIDVPLKIQIDDGQAVFLFQHLVKSSPASSRFFAGPVQPIHWLR